MAAETKCNLIIDSCCDLPREVVDAAGVSVIEFSYITSDGAHNDDFFSSITPHDFYEGMRKGEAPSTSQMPMSAFQDAFMEAVSSGVPTVYLSFSSCLSGSFNTALLVRDRILKEHPDFELHVVDTKLASIAEGLLVYEALRQRDRGLSAAELAAWAAEARYYVNELFMVDNLEALKRGGRIPSSVAFAGAKLDVKPLLDITLDGKLALVGVARGRKKGIRQLVEFYKKRKGQGDYVDERVVIGNADCPKDAQRLKDELSKIDESLMFMDASIGPVIGSHVGPGMVALCFWGPDSREALTVSDRIAKRIRQGADEV